MHMLQKWISNTTNNIHKKTAALNAKLNFNETQNISYEVNGKKTSLENLQIHEDTFRMYIGAMNKERKDQSQQTYSDELIIGIVHYLLTHHQLNTIEIVLGTPVSDQINKDPSKMTTNEQETYINTLIQRHFNKKNSNKVHIVSLDKIGYKTIIDNARQDIPTTEPEIESKEDIYKYLWWLYQNNKSFAKDIQKTIPHTIEKNKDTNHYALIEIACRLGEYIDWITLQWWVTRQKKYDQTIINLLNTFYTNYGECKTLRAYIQKHTTEDFKALYFDTDKTEVVVNKIETKNHTTNKLRNITMAISGSLLIAFIGVGGGFKRQEHRQQKKLEKITEQNIADIISSKNIQVSGMYSLHEMETLNEKKEFIEKTTNDIYDKYKELYNNGEEWDKKQYKILKTIIIDELLRDNNYKLFSNNMILWYQTQEFIINNLIKNNKNSLNQIGLSTALYPDLLQREKAIYNTLFLDNDKEINIETPHTKDRERNNKNPDYVEYKRKYEDMIENRKFKNGILYARGSTKKNIKYLWSYHIHTPTRDGLTNRWSIVEYTDYMGEKYIAWIWVYWKESMRTEDIKPFLYRYLYQSKPEIKKIVDTYQEIFFQYETERSSIKNDYSREKKRFMNNVLPLLVMDIIQHDDIIKKINETHDPRKIIITYIENEFLPKHTDRVESFWDVKLDKKPYPHMQNNIQALRNTIKNGMNNLPSWLNASQRDKDEKNHNIESISVIWPYRTEKGINYNVALVTIDDKQYIYAENREKRHYSTWFSLYDGIEIAQEFLDTYYQE